MITVPFIPTTTILGTCNVQALNCLTEKKADSIMHQIMQTCNICDCQLIN